MPQKPYKPPYAHLFQTIYVCRQDLSNNQISLKKTESAVLISLPLFYHIFDQKQHNFDQFFQKIWKKFFCPKHSVFDGKLNGESIFFGPMVLKNFVFSESGLFHKWWWWFSTQKWHSFLHWNNHYGQSTGARALFLVSLDWKLSREFFKSICELDIRLGWA